MGRAMSEGIAVRAPAVGHGAGLHALALGDAEALLSLDEDLAVLLSEPTSLGGAAAVAAAWRADGPRLLTRLQGPFALAIATPERLLLAIDRAGVRPLYLREHAGALYFATRLAALTQVPGADLELDDQALFDYLYFHMVPSPGCIYRGVTKLLPGQVLTREADGRQALAFYWQMPYQDRQPARFAELRRTFRDLLPRVVGDAAADSAQVGCFLSGGTDSSTVAGTLAGLRAEPVPTYSIGFAADGYDEMDYARIAARHFHTRPREFYVTPDQVLASIPSLAAFCDEPFGNASIVPAYLCARAAAADGIACLLAGDGGDEIFAGNERYANQWVFELYARLPTAARALIAGALRLPGSGALPLLRKAQSYVQQASMPLPARLQSYNFLHRTPLAEVFTPAFLQRVDPTLPLANLDEVYQRTASRAMINRLMHLDLKITLADNDLRKVNQACQLAGVAVRYPLLDDRMLAFAASVPAHMQLRRTRLRWFFKRALADFLPAEIIAKTKHGFGLPVGVWMQTHDGFHALVSDSLAALARRDILQPGYIAALQHAHRNTHAAYYGVMLWVLMMLEQWLSARGR